MHCPCIFYFAAVILLTCNINWSCGVTVEFYEFLNYKRFLDKMTVDPNNEKKCTKLDKFLDVRSVKTDKCLMIYERDDCRRLPSYWKETDYVAEYSIRVENNTSMFPQSDELYRYRRIGYKRWADRQVQSFHVCNQELGGGSKLDVDLYDNLNYKGNLVKSWKGVCRCENIPSYINIGRDNYFSIDNHGNSMSVFRSENCVGKEAVIPAGDNDVSRRISIRNQFPSPVSFVVRSFRPTDPTSCYELDASIYKFTFYNGSELGGYTEENVKLATTQTLINNGALPLTQAIEFSKTIGNSVEYTVAKAFTYVNSAGVKAGVTTETKLDLPLIVSSTVKFSLEANYQHTSTHQNTDTNRTVSTESETVKVTTTVQVASCEKCDVTGFVKTVRDFPVAYIAESLVKGTAGGEKLTAAEIRPYLPPGMKYIRDVDQYSVQTSVEGQMKAEFAWKTFISKTCGPVPNCRSHYIGPDGQYTEVYEVPFSIAHDEGKDS